MRSGRELGITWLTLVVVAVILAAGAAFIELRNTVSTDAIGRGGEAGASGQDRIPPDRPVEGFDVREPSSDAPAVPFQIRPAAVVQDVGPEDRTGPITQQSAESSQPTAVSTEPSAGAETTSGPSPAEPPSSDRTTQPVEPSAATAPAAEAPAPGGPAPAVAAQVPAPEVAAPRTPPSRTPDPAASSEPPTASPPTTPDAAATRGQSATHRPEHANGGVGNTERPAAADPGPKPDK